MAGLDSKLVWIYIGIGLIANVAYGLLKPLFKTLWARINRPTPLTLENKVRLAQQVEMQKRSLERLNHMAANPKDLYLYLFQVVLMTFVCILGAQFIFVLGF
jgi:hypothetical protein